jgi:hypothetical protein
MGVMSLAADAPNLLVIWPYGKAGAVQKVVLLIFDRHATRSWAEKVFVKREVYRGVGSTVWGM